MDRGLGKISQNHEHILKTNFKRTSRKKKWNYNYNRSFKGNMD